MRKNFAVIGLGIFGMSIAKTLVENGCEVIAIDKSAKKVQEISDHVTVAVTLDATDETALREAGVNNVDTAVVCIGESIEANILTVMILKELGIAKIVTKAVTELHERLLQNMGITAIVHPERDMGVRLANSLVKSNIFEMLELSPEYSIVEIIAPAHMDGKTILESDARKKYGVNIIAIRKSTQEGLSVEKDRWDINPKPETMIDSGDALLILGHASGIDLFSK